MKPRETHEIYEAELAPCIGYVILLLERFDLTAKIETRGETQLNGINRFIWIVDHQGKLLFYSGRQFGYPSKMMEFVRRDLFETQKHSARIEITLWLRANAAILHIGLDERSELSCGQWEKVTDDDLCELVLRHVVKEHECFPKQLKSETLKDKLKEACKQVEEYYVKIPQVEKELKTDMKDRF